ncbi:hypothetical protein GCM10009751_25210 [Myceligenerans crystallogenes]|uniref:Uncharacterized protein n=1 Tax=Myceligenerans crystallogenes TaxID=316335 RepID=A0ABP4ZSJ8_9MICO
MAGRDEDRGGAMNGGRGKGPGAGPVFWVLLGLVGAGLALMIAVPLAGR